MKDKLSKILPGLYVTWVVFVLVVTFMRDKFSPDNITHIVILIELFGSLLLFRLFRPAHPKRFFIMSGVFLAAIGEGAYMISKPVLDNLLVTLPISWPVFFHNYFIDLALTLPVYVLIFWVIWKLINYFHYSKWEYIFLMALGQSIGDGSSFFFLNPFLLLFIPYIMINYHAMNLAPYLRIQHYLLNKPRSNSLWKYPLTVIILYITYFIGGTCIKIVTGLLNLG